MLGAQGCWEEVRQKKAPATLSFWLLQGPRQRTWLPLPQGLLVRAASGCPSPGLGDPGGGQGWVHQAPATLTFLWGSSWNQLLHSLLL